MNIRHSINRASFDALSPSNKSSGNGFVIAPCLIQDAIETPSLIEAKKRSLIIFNRLDEVKEKVISLATQNKSGTQSLLAPLVIWQIAITPFLSYTKKNFPDDIARQKLKRLTIQSQWEYNEDTEQIEKVPTSTIPNLAPSSGHPIADPPQNVTIKTETANELIANVEWKHALDPFLQCPYSQTPYSNTVITPHGYTYNQSEIDAHLRLKACDPIHKTKLLPKDLIPNKTLNNVIINIGTIMEHNDTRLLLCPVSKLPLENPVIINPTSTTGKQLLSLIHPDNNTPIFTLGQSINKTAIAAHIHLLAKNSPFKLMSEQDLIPNRVLSQLLTVITSYKKEHMTPQRG